MSDDCSDFRQKPPLAITGWPVLGAVAGHIVKGHLLVNTIDTMCPVTPASQFFLKLVKTYNLYLIIGQVGPGFCIKTYAKTR